jgi:hypothetical protein
LTQVREAYECLSDKAKRAAYDALYFDLKDQWTSYREWQETQRKDQQQKRADEEQRAARERAERERKAAEAERARRMEEEKRAAKEKAEREERERQAEERSKEAARRAREQQEQVAKERLRRERESEAEKRSEEAASKVRIEQERAAQERLKSILIEEQQDAIRRNWTKMREAAERREGEPAQPSRSSSCDHPQFGWPRKKARQTAYSAGSPAQNGLFAAQSAMCQLVQVVNINIAYISLRLKLSWLQQPEVSRDSRDFAREGLETFRESIQGFSPLARFAC